MLEQLTPFRLCSGQPTQRYLNPLPPRRWKFTPRNNPQPKRVRHFNDIQNMPICYVRESASASRLSGFQDNENSALVRSNTFTGLPMFRYRNIPYKEKAIPKLGLFPVQEPWRRELHALTECIVTPVLEGLGKSEDLSKLIECHPYPICRPITAWKFSEMLNIKNRNSIFPTREKLRTPKFSTVSVKLDENIRYDNHFPDDFESQVFSLLGQVLQCTDIESIQFWLATASDREKASMMTILQTAFEGKMKKDIVQEDARDTEMKKSEDSCSSSVRNEPDNDVEEADRLLINSRQSSRTELFRPKTQASKIRPQTSNSCVSRQSSLLPKKPLTAPVYLRYKTNINTKSIQTDDIEEEVIQEETLKDL